MLIFASIEPSKKCWPNLGAAAGPQASSNTIYSQLRSYPSNGQTESKPPRRKAPPCLCNGEVEAESGKDEELRNTTVLPEIQRGEERKEGGVILLLCAPGSVWRNPSRRVVPNLLLQIFDPFFLPWMLRMVDARNADFEGGVFEFSLGNALLKR